MKFNKAKLAALVTSVFMSVALFAGAAFAEEAKHVDENPTQPATEETKGSQEIANVTFSASGKVEVELQDGTKYTDTATKKLVDNAPTCLKEGEVVWEYEGYKSETFKLAKLKHQPSAEKVQITIKEATHSQEGDETGLAYIGYICVRDCCKGKTVWVDEKGNEIADPASSDLVQKVEVSVVHDWQPIEYIPVDTEWLNQESKTSVPTLKDETHGARYDVLYECKNGGEKKLHSELYSEYVKIEPTKSTSWQFNIYDENCNIKGLFYQSEEDGSWDIYYTDNYLPPEFDASKIVLLDCSKPGYYATVYSSWYVTADQQYKNLYYDREGKQIYGEPVYDADGKAIGLKNVSSLTGVVKNEIPAHHVYTGLEKVNKHSKNVSYVVYDFKGNKLEDTNEGYKIDFYNNSCVEEGTYVLWHECVGGKPGLKDVSWVADPQVKLPANKNAHKISAGYNETEIEKALKSGEWDASKIYGYGVKYDGKGYDVSKLENVTATCTKDGTGDMVWYCTVCGEKLKTVTVPVKALGHNLAEKRENIVEPTCGKDGSYDAVQYCLRCGEEISRKQVIDPKTNKHVYGDDTIAWVGNVVVDYNGSIKAKDTSEDNYKEVADDEEDATIGVEYIGTPAGSQFGQSYAQDYFVYGKAVKVCTVCGHRALDGIADLTVVSVEKSTKNGYPGVITIKAEYKDADGKVLATDTKAFDYYTSINEYQSRVEKAPEEDPTPVDPEQPEVPEQLPAVENLKAATTGMNKVTLTWDAVEGANGYLILKNGTQIAYTTGATTYTDKNASSENFEFYWVLPYQTVNGKNYKGELSNYVWGIGRVVGQVQKVTATGAEGAVELSWNAVSGANGYVILSKTGSNTAPFNAAVETTETSATVKAEAGKVQFYWVYATYTNADGNKVAAGKCSPFAWAIAE